ncbi:YccT family protein [Vibrio splendidus]|uniref:YccT family protein n=1 Tax=Vibrio splendidus TaxID=29497 RepID=UPI003CE4ADC9
MKKALVVLGLLTSVIGSVSAATLTPQKGVSILYINGQAAQNKIGENQINEGFNQVLVRFDKKFGNSGVYSSAPYVLNFDVTGEEVEIKSPKVRSYMEAEKIFEAVNPSWVVFQDDVAIKYQQDMIKRKPGFAPLGGLESRLAEHNESKAVYFKDGVLLDKPAETVVLASVVNDTAVQTSSKAQKPVKLAETQNIEQLQAWYIKASKQERKEFRKWMIDQE